MSTATATTFLSISPATARIEKGSLVVSVHDVVPETRAVTEEILSELTHHGISVCSILVIPNYHHRGSSLGNKDFSLWLRQLEGRGHEIVIHGYFHQRPRQPNDSLQAKFITRFYTKDEGEFYDLSYDEALLRITRARDEFQEIGVRPRGFIAPAWLLSAEGERAAANAGLEYTTRLTRVRDLRSGKDFFARSLVFSVRSGWRQAASVAWNRILLPHADSKPLFRLSVHPADYRHAEVWRQILKATDTVIAARKVTTYGSWLDEVRASASGDN